MCRGYSNPHPFTKPFAFTLQTNIGPDILHEQTGWALHPKRVLLCPGYNYWYHWNNNLNCYLYNEKRSGAGVPAGKGNNWQQYFVVRVIRYFSKAVLLHYSLYSSEDSCFHRWPDLLKSVLYAWNIIDFIFCTIRKKNKQWAYNLPFLSN